MLDLPQLNHFPDLVRLHDICENYMTETIKGNDDAANNLVQYAFEEAMMALYGKGIFTVLRELKSRNDPDGCPK